MSKQMERGVASVKAMERFVKQKTDKLNSIKYVKWYKKYHNTVSEELEKQTQIRQKFNTLNIQSILLSSNPMEKHYYSQ